ncbi:hypothetical protein [Hyphomonas sp.]|uniref:hypothetical protein n=1 Tax=Hyphomonas sp. TaxID=87 RepID=UPI0032EF23FC
MTRLAYHRQTLFDRSIPAVLFLVIVAAFLIFYDELILSSFLVQDDNRHLPRGIFNQVEVARDSPGKFYVIILGSLSGSIGFVKSLTLAFFGLLAACIYLALKPLIASRLLRAGVALFITTFPVAVDQPYFLTGAHPTMGVAMVMAALAWVTLSLYTERRVLVAFIGALVICIFAFRFSPTMFLIPLAPALWAGGAVILGKLERRYIVFYCVPVVLLGILLAWLGYQAAHYTSSSNWNSALEASVFSNLYAALTMPIDRLARHFEVASFVYAVVGLALIAASVWLAIRIALGLLQRKVTLSDQDIIRLFLFIACAIAGGLAFGPSALAANFLDRYSIPVLIFTSLGLFAMVSILLSRMRPRVLTGAGILLLLASAWNMSIRSDWADRIHGRALHTHHMMSQIAQRDADSWPENSQIVFLLGNGEGVTTGGLNHWSTWYVRAISGREDLIGLVGFDKWAMNDPFVDIYRDHGPEYWNAERSGRFKMFGLERDRPTFVYYIKRGDEQANATPVAFPSESGFDVLTPGATLKSVRSGEAQNASVAGSFLWRPQPKGFVSREGCNGDLPATRQQGDVEVLSTAAGETYNLKATIPLGACFSLELAGLPALPVTGTVKMSDTTPPMPLFGGAIAIYQKDKYYSVILRETGEEVRIEHEADDQPFRIVVYGKAGRWSELYVGGFSYALPPSILHDGMLMGKGFLERAWAGELSLALAVNGQWKPEMLAVPLQQVTE